MSLETVASSDISIIIPAYNQSRWIESTLASVQAQTHQSWECMVVNDGSTDDTEQKVRALAASDKRIILLNQPNAGVSAARNRGLKEVRGRYVLFLDGDDLLLPHKLEYQLEELEKADAEVHISAVRVDWVRDTSSALHGSVWAPPHELANPFMQLLKSWEVGLVLPIHAFLTRADLLTRTTRAQWNPQLYSHEDWDFWLQVMAENPKVVTSPEVTAIYRVHGTSATSLRYRCWKGYLQSLAIQRERYTKVPGALEALDIHYAQMHRAYRSCFPVRRWLIDHLVGREWFQRGCPWPIQKHLREFCGA